MQIIRKLKCIDLSKILKNQLWPQNLKTVFFPKELYQVNFKLTCYCNFMQKIQKNSKRQG